MCSQCHYLVTCSNHVRLFLLLSLLIFVLAFATVPKSNQVFSMHATLDVVSVQTISESMSEFFFLSFV